MGGGGGEDKQLGARIDGAHWSNSEPHAQPTHPAANSLEQLDKWKANRQTNWRKKQKGKQTNILEKMKWKMKWQTVTQSEKWKWKGKQTNKLRKRKSNSLDKWKGKKSKSLENKAKKQRDKLSGGGTSSSNNLLITCSLTVFLWIKQLNGGEVMPCLQWWTLLPWIIGQL